MYRLPLLGCFAGIALIALGHSSLSQAPARAVINDNRDPAGLLGAGVLRVQLEVRETVWHPDADTAAGLPVRAFAQVGGPALVPGPLIRVPEGTEIRATVRNALASDTLVVRGLSTRSGTAKADSLVVPPGTTRETRFVAGPPGTYYYTGSTGGTVVDRATRDAVLTGALVVDPEDAPPVPGDRVFVISLWHASPRPNLTTGRTDLLRFAINGKSWPHTERLAYTAGDTVRFRVVNATTATHPMHLHGFYFRVDSRGNGASDTVYSASMQAPAEFVVTERVTPGGTFSATWVPERAGNWMFHCHDNYHVLRNRPLDGAALPPEHEQHVSNHAVDMMGGLVMAISVQGGEAAPPSAGGRRRLRLLAGVDSGGTEAEPSYGYAMQEWADSGTSMNPSLPGPTIVLTRGEPVAITVVNALPEPTAVHWHGIELESYYDGVADFSGSGSRIAGAIAPGDSFQARFTPPRSGTFIYHPHADEVRQQQAGLSGALLVVDSSGAYDPSTDFVILISVPRREAEHTASVLLNGSATPRPLELRVGVPHRFRIVNIHTFRPNTIVRLMHDAAPVTWRGLAKDGMDLPPARATLRPAVQQVSNGETYDFEFTPTAPADLQLTVSSAAGALLVTMPVRIR